MLYAYNFLLWVLNHEKPPELEEEGKNIQPIR